MPQRVKLHFMGAIVLDSRDLQMISMVYDMTGWLRIPVLIGRCGHLPVVLGSARAAEL